jgi:hypothetical protein
MNSPIFIFFSLAEIGLWYWLRIEAKVLLSSAARQVNQVHLSVLFLLRSQNMSVRQPIEGRGNPVMNRVVAGVAEHDEPTVIVRSGTEPADDMVDLHSPAGAVLPEVADSAAVMGLGVGRQ